ncbi:MAG: shikimate kinase [Cyanobacteria bacterium MAG STY4_bin_9]|jgi:shikimate kinase|uniref:shikimate kinase n=1 Tax=Synechococcus sp. N32 TaxID=2575514 RepID=UPI000C5902ED|nr:shikimate kinase [Synechococcus sp. N32]MBN89646.1 shikimate kinase [Synechococcus sp. RS344]MDD9804745.1 shikimate kinase [Cyanobacteria bacterium MAG STY1_bin_7]MDD9861436.1 shikimate kinase [Cyanobacteria bacterium MAG STY2_bin_7]MDD9882650.1 shikimate kinase [Cyanobacteria bacterium MAG STY4_bin_9]|tara:strand:- start:163 stop:738 length:576 start_codon:yes stop_codon:yes gene_type:complete
MADSTPTLKQRLAGRSLYLVGMMGSGKTSTGRPLAERLGYGFVDADAVIEQAAGCSIPDIFDRDGEAGFRSLESQVLSAISQRHSLVVATGGGVVTQPENWGMLHSGIVIWLDVVPDQLLQRLNADSTVRPLLQTADPEAALNALLNERRPLYAEADLTVVINDETPEAVADGILQLVPSLLKDPTQRRTD